MTDESMSDYYRSHDEAEPVEEPPPFVFDWHADYFDWCSGDGWRCERAGNNNINPPKHYLGPPEVEVTVYYPAGAPRYGGTALTALVCTDDPQKLSVVIRHLLGLRDRLANMAEPK